MSSEALLPDAKARPERPGFFCIEPEHVLLAVTALMCLILAGCQAAPSERLAKAQRIAGTSRMAERDIDAPPFRLRSYARIGNPASGTARIYIEGDGLAWLSKSRPSPDPTPINPVALALADADPGPNVIWLARPCQYHLVFAGQPCPPPYWQAARFAPEVIAAMSDALDQLKREHRLSRLELVGFSGGGAIALLLGARRSDIVSIRTVAGNLDTDGFTRLHKVSPMSASLNPAADARRVATIPQRHFIGAKDRIVPAGIYRGYRAAAGSDARISLTVVAEVGHEDGWVERWPELVAQPVP
jgi:hypothetical protein